MSRRGIAVHQQVEDRLMLLRRSLASPHAWQVSAALQYVAEVLDHEHRAALVPELVELSTSLRWPCFANDARALLETI